MKKSIGSEILVTHLVILFIWTQLCREVVPMEDPSRWLSEILFKNYSAKVPKKE
jgi:hypothetical protein